MWPTNGTLQPPSFEDTHGFAPPWEEPVPIRTPWSLPNDGALSGEYKRFIWITSLQWGLKNVLRPTLGFFGKIWLYDCLVYVAMKLGKKIKNKIITEYSAKLAFEINMFRDLTDIALDWRSSFPKIQKVDRYKRAWVTFDKYKRLWVTFTVQMLAFIRTAGKS